MDDGGSEGGLTELDSNPYGPRWREGEWIGLFDVDGGRLTWKGMVKSGLGKAEGDVDIDFNKVSGGRDGVKLELPPSSLLEQP